VQSPPAASGPRLGSFAAVLWDMDGTLVDTEPTWMAAEQALADRHGATWSHEQALELVGSDLLHSGRRIREGMGIDLTPAQIVEELLDSVVLEVRRSVPWRPGARELLSSLREAGVPRALVTMSYTRLVDPVLAALPPGTFDAVVTGDVVDRGKPHPEPYLTAARLLDVLASECLAIEDSDTGATSAAAAGCTVLCVPLHVVVPPGPRRVFADSLADLTASSPLPGAADCGLAPIRRM
jgi:HAD superfamily hydrolase (TIGR01509 family)